MRVVSLLPAGTEIVAALGAAIGETTPTAGNGPRLVGISHECDFPPDVRALPRVTSTTIDPSWSSGEIDRAVTAAKVAGRPAITIDAERLSQLRPDVVIGQSICDVCAVGDDTLAPALAALPARPGVVMLHAHTMDGVFADISRVGQALALSDEADELVAVMRYRLRRIQERSPSNAAHRVPRTLVLEWLTPPYVAGHWVPELVALAGGEDVGNVALQLRDDEPRRLFSRGVEFLDGNAYTSRPGPRLVDAAERLARLIGR